MVCELNSPQIVAAVSAPIAPMTPALTASPGPRLAVAPAIPRARRRTAHHSRHQARLPRARGDTDQSRWRAASVGAQAGLWPMPVQARPATLAGMTTNQAVNSPATQPAAIVAPAPGTYRIDAARSAITFTTRHLFGLGPVRGRFDLREGSAGSPTRWASPRPGRRSPPRASAPATPAATARSARPGCSTPARTPTSPSSRGGSTGPAGDGSCTACCRCAGTRTRSSCSSRRPSRPGRTCACGRASASTATTWDHQGQGAGRPAPPWLLARHRRPPALNRASPDAGRQLHGSDRR